MTPFDRRVLLAFILLFGFCARAATYKAPLLDHHGWRQADTASIARNFFRERFNILYPQVDQRGGNLDGYVETGLELFAFFIAALSFAVGFHHETGRLLSALLFLGSSLLLWTFVRRRYGERAAVISAFLYGFGFPLLLFIERAFMNEALLIFLSLACLKSTQQYIDRPAPQPIAVLALCSSLIAMVKLPYLIIWLPVAGLFIERDGVRALRRVELWIVALVNLGAAGLWYSHAHRLGRMTGLSFGITDKLFDPAVVFSLEFPVWLTTRLVQDILGPIAFVAYLAGVVVAWRGRRWCECLGAVSFLIYVPVVAWGNFHHDYYQLAIIPTAPVLAAVGLIWLGDRAAQSKRVSSDTFVVAALALAALSTFVRSVSAHSWYDFDTMKIETCRSIHELAGPDERLVFVGEENPELLFCIDRKGWLLAPGDADEPAIRRVQSAGAQLFVVPFTYDRQNVRALIASSGTPLLMNRLVEVYRLR